MHNLYRHLAACDLAVVQGGLTTSMELTAQKRPFLYFPLRHHFEQNFHVRHRLERYGAGRRMDFDDSPPEAIAEAIAGEIGREVEYRDVEADGAARAAGRLAELLLARGDGGDRLELARLVAERPDVDALDTRPRRTARAAPRSAPAVPRRPAREACPGPA